MVTKGQSNGDRDALESQNTIPDRNLFTENELANAMTRSTLKLSEGEMD